jgi:hypothetical protein
MAHWVISASSGGTDSAFARRRFLSEVLGVEELGGWMGETVVDFGELWIGDGAGRVKEE